MSAAALRKLAPAASVTLALLALSGAGRGLAGTAVLQTDKTGYLAGQMVTVQATGFAAGEVVTVAIAHANTPAESDPTPWTVTADALGAFTLPTGWAIDPNDSAGHAFVVTATGASGTAESAFHRIAVVYTNQFDYRPGEVALISGAGFRPNEAVTLDVTHVSGLLDGPAHTPFTTAADASGSISAAWPVPFYETLGSIFSLTAVGSDSGLAALTFFTDPPITIVDDNGADDYPGQKDLNQLQVDKANLPTSQAISWNWDDSAWSGGNTGDACSLFDTDGDGFANYSLCVTVEGDPAAYQSTRLYSCGDTKSDRCEQPTTLISPFASTCGASVVPNSDPFGVPGSPYYDPDHLSGNTCSDNKAGAGLNLCYTADTVAACTVTMADFGNPLSAFLINVCSYPSQVPNSAPSECVVTPNNGFLTIVKVDAETNDLTPFTFNLGTGQTSQNGTSSWTINGSGSVQLISFAPGTTHDLSEVVPSAWNLDSASCAVQTNPPTLTGTLTDDTISDFEIRSGQETICTFTDSKKKASLTVIKQVVNDNGGTKVASDFQIDVTGTDCNPNPGSFTGLESPGQDVDLEACTYSVTEVEDALYTATYSADCSGTIAAGEEKTCTITNDDKAPRLTLNKAVVNNNGGSAKPEDWTLTAAGLTTTLTGVGPTVTSDSGFLAGTYALSESGPTGYTASDWVCVGGTQDGSNITLALDESADCTITNDDNAATLTLNKVVVNDDGGTAEASAWTLIATGPTSFSGPGPSVSNGSNFAVGTYDLSESGGPSGYTASAWACVGGTQNGSSITLALGELATCTITNDDQPAYVIVNKVVNNDDGGSAYPDDFKLTLDGNPTLSGVPVKVNPGSHTAAETQLSGYTFTGYSSDCNSSGAVTVALGETKTCTLTNDDQQAYVIVNKAVINNNGGSANPDDFKLTLNGNSTLSGQAVAVDPGTYTAGETQLSGYTFLGFSDDCDVNGNVTVALGETRTCTLTNDDQQAYVTVVKIVNNDNGGLAQPDDFKLTLDGGSVQSGAKLPVNPGTHTAAEALLPGYNFDGFSGACDVNGNVTVALGESKTCTLTNSDNPPSLTLVKVVDNTWCKGAACATESSFTLTASGPTGFSGPGPSVSSGAGFYKGTYTLTESGPAGYTASLWSCAGGTLKGDQVTLGLGESATCTITNSAIPAQLQVVKALVPADDAGRFNLTIDGIPIVSGVGNGEATGFVLVTTGVPHTVGETAAVGTLLSNYVTTIGAPCGTNGAITLNPGNTATCVITNVKKGQVTLHKLTNGLDSENMTWNFSLNGPGVSTTDSSPPTTVDFGGSMLEPGKTYTLCETGIPAAWTLEWQVDTTKDGTPDTIIPFYAGGNAPPTPWTGYSNVYDPNYVTPPGIYTNDTRCVQFTVEPGQTLAFQINNSYPGGEPRTIGFWKNWNLCTGGRQQYVAEANGGPAAGWFLLDDLLNNPGFTIGILKLDPGECTQAVDILNKSDIGTHKKMASDAAYNLAAQLLAAELNLSAGAETCPLVVNATNSAQSLLVAISFDGTGAFLKKGATYNQANTLAATLDKYNNGLLCQ